jgi:hypothetical protein
VPTAGFLSTSAGPPASSFRDLENCEQGFYVPATMLRFAISTIGNP